MQFALFLLLNAILLIRPAEMIEALEPLRLYQLVAIGCILLSYPGLIEQMTTRSLIDRPITVGVLGILLAIILSHLQFGSIWGARMGGNMFGRVVLYYLLLVHNLDTPQKFQRFLNAVVLFTLVAVCLALAHFYEYVEIPALEALEQREIDPETGESIVFPRLVGTGIFNDPNDICLVLIVVITICLYRLMAPEAGPTRFVWLAPLVPFLIAFIETKSRGGFIGLMVAANVALVSQLGIRKCIPIWLMGLPLVLVVFGGRMTRIDVEGGTGQHRVQLWRESLALLRHYPLLGVGQGLLASRVGLGAHNSYVHSFAELGILGGTVFISLVYMSIAQLHQLRHEVHQIADPGMRRLRLYLLAILCGYCAGMLSLSRMYIVPTYLLFGLTAAYIRQARAVGWNVLPQWRFTPYLMMRLAAVGMLALVALEIGSRALVRW